MSCGICQRGEENEGVSGFLVDDIKQEIRRSARLVRPLSFTNPLLLLSTHTHRRAHLWLSDLLRVQDEGCERWLQRQDLQEDGALPLQQEDALHFPVLWTLPVSPGCLSEG